MSINKVFIYPSSIITFKTVAFIIGAREVNSLKLTSSSYDFYEIHLRSKYNKVGSISGIELMKISKIINTNFPNTIFYSYAPIELEKLCRVKNLKVHHFKTQIDNERSRKLKRKCNDDFELYLIEIIK